MAANTTHREGENCGKIQGVKIWHQYPLEMADLGDLFDTDKSEIMPSGVIFLAETTGFARLRKQNSLVVALNKQLSDLSRVPNLEIGINISPKLDPEITNELENLLVDANDIQTILIRFPNESDFHKPDSKSNRPVGHKRHSTYLQLNKDVPTRRLETLFKVSQENGITGIAMFAEQLSRGQIALARKFSLEIMITEILNERHESSVLASAVDHGVVIAS